jgi:hypothetical protein
MKIIKPILCAALPEHILAVTEKENRADNSARERTCNNGAHGRYIMVTAIVNSARTWSAKPGAPLF